MLYKYLLRELLGLAIVISVVLGVLGILLDLFGLTALFEHQASIAHIFFSESMYFIVFLVPPYFLWKWLSNPDLTSARQRYLELKLDAERN